MSKEIKSHFLIKNFALHAICNFKYKYIYTQKLTPIKKRMKAIIRHYSLFFFLAATPFLMQASCSKNNDDVVVTPPPPPTLPAADQYITATLNSATTVFKTPTDSLSFSKTSSSTSLNAGTQPATSYIGINFSGSQTIGNFPIDIFSLSINGRDYLQGATALTATVTTYGAIGAYIIGSYSGMVRSSSSSSSAFTEVKGDFRFKVK